MKRLVLLAAALSLAMAAKAQQSASGPHTDVFTTTGAGTTINLQNNGAFYQQLTWTVSANPLSACTVILESSVDGVTWSTGRTIIGATTCTAPGQTALTAASAAFVRIAVTALSGGNVTVTYNGFNYNVKLAPSAASVPFSGITSGTNTTAAMTVGTGGSLATSGTGTIVASTLNDTNSPGTGSNFESVSGPSGTHTLFTAADNGSGDILYTSEDKSTFTTSTIEYQPGGPQIIFTVNDAGGNGTLFVVGETTGSGVYAQRLNGDQPVTLGVAGKAWSDLYLADDNTSGDYAHFSLPNPFTGVRTITIPDANSATVASATSPITFSGSVIACPSCGTTLAGVTASIGGAALAVGACATGTVAITGATSAVSGGAIITATPNTFPGTGFNWGREYLSAADTVTVQVCADVAGTPTASTYNVKVLK